MLTSPDNLWSPDTGTEFKPTIDTAAMQDSVQAALTRNQPGRLIRVDRLVWANLSASGSVGDSTLRVWGEASRDIATFELPDPGVPYRVQMYADGFWGRELDSTEARYDFDMSVGGVTVYSKPPGAEGSSYAVWRSWSPPASEATFTGSKTLAFRGRRISGPTNSFGAVRPSLSTVIAMTFTA